MASKCPTKAHPQRALQGLGKYERGSDPEFTADLQTEALGYGSTSSYTLV